jgi:hypothetical protein
MSEFGWWAISGDRLLDMLRRVEAGESPDVVYTEEYANGHPEQVEPETREISGRLGRFLHNVVAHPLLVLCPPLGERLHERTEP